MIIGHYNDTRHRGTMNPRFVIFPCPTHYLICIMLINLKIRRQQSRIWAELNYSIYCYYTAIWFRTWIRHFQSVLNFSTILWSQSSLRHHSIFRYTIVVSYIKGDIRNVSPRQATQWASVVIITRRHSSSTTGWDYHCRHLADISAIGSEWMISLRIPLWHSSFACAQRRDDVIRGNGSDWCCRLYDLLTSCHSTGSQRPHRCCLCEWRSE